MCEHKEAAKHILVTGGAGFIGSHTCIELLAAGYRVTVADNLSNSSEESLRRVRVITGKPVVFCKVDLRDKPKLKAVFKAEGPFDAVIHFAALKAVGESVELPLLYYQNNLVGTLTLCEVMQEQNCHSIVFSSSATVYGFQEKVPVPETASVNPTNPYGRTKLFIEDILIDLTRKPDSKWRVINLRYFNPVGAHISGSIGEDPQGHPNNLMPYIQQVAVGRRPHLVVFGNDYDTHDGTGVRDYIHVVDLAKGHVAALDHGIFGAMKAAEDRVYNLGTGKGYSVFDMLNAFSKCCGKKLAHKLGSRREGDVAILTADPTRANEELKWKANKTLEDMCADSWRWQKNNPFGFRGNVVPE